MLVLLIGLPSWLGRDSCWVMSILVVLVVVGWFVEYQIELGCWVGGNRDSWVKRLSAWSVFVLFGFLVILTLSVELFIHIQVLRMTCQPLLSAYSSIFDDCFSGGGGCLSVWVSSSERFSNELIPFEGSMPPQDPGLKYLETLWLSIAKCPYWFIESHTTGSAATRSAIRPTVLQYMGDLQYV